MMKTTVITIEYNSSRLAFNRKFPESLTGKILEEEFRATMNEINTAYIGEKGQQQRSLSFCSIFLMIVLLVFITLSILSFRLWKNIIGGVITILCCILFAVGVVATMDTSTKNDVDADMDIKRVIDRQNRKYIDRGVLWEFRRNTKTIRRGDQVVILKSPQILVFVDPDKNLPISLLDPAVRAILW